MYRTILVPIDGSSAATAGLEEAIRIAVHVGAKLHFMTIVDDTAFRGNGEGVAAGLAADKLGSAFMESGEKVLRHAKARAEEAGVDALTSLVHGDDVRLQALVARQAEECGADLIVLGTHGRRGLSRLFMGRNDDEHLLNVVHVPVLLVRSQDMGPDLSVVEITASDSMFQAKP